MQHTSDKVVKVASFDGQTLWSSHKTALYEVGNFLGGGAAGTVYEAENVLTKEHVALKILNPLGYKLLSSSLLRRCSIISKGKSFNDTGSISKVHVWWLINNNTKQYIAAYYSEKQNCLLELSLGQCMQVWGLGPAGVGACSGEEAIASRTGPQADGSTVFVPVIPPKYAEFVRLRSNIFREIENMRKISNHINVICLKDVLELVQESKCTIFLVMELANGGELFDRIKIDCGTREGTAKVYFRQLLNGVSHCHEAGVCHSDLWITYRRDLKPENLLLQDSANQESLLKIADFGFSARFAMAVQDEETVAAPNYATLRQGGESPMRILKSVVGSPFYVAPEVLQECGYDGTKADVWSMGVILYAMLAGNLPFAQDLSSCQRFRHFCRWAREQRRRSPQYWDDLDLRFPDWLFPTRFSTQAKSLIVAMLHPDPKERITVNEAKYHAWCEYSDKISALPPEIVESCLPSCETDEIIIEHQCVSFNNYCESNDGDEIFRMEEEYNHVTVSESLADGPSYFNDNNILASKLQDARGRSLFTPSPTHPSTSSTDFVHGVMPDDSILSSRGEIRRDVYDGADSILTDAFDYDFMHPPSFHDNVKRSTRFITSVPSTTVLETVEDILNDCRINKIVSPMGMIGKVELHWEYYSLDVWGCDTSGPPLCSLHIYQLPKSTPPSPASYIPCDSSLTIQTNLYLVDFVRGQVEIFVFKRFYEWVRQKVNELVKRDYTFRLFDQAGSPMYNCIL